MILKVVHHVAKVYKKRREVNMHFQHLQLLTRDLERQLEFYQNVLGLPAPEQLTNSVTFQIGSSRLEFVQDSRDVFYHFAFNVPSHQFAEAKNWLSKRVALIKDSLGNDEFPANDWNADNIYFYDAGGNVAEFIARYDLKSDVVEPFSARSLECVSELGIVAGDVPHTVKRIQDVTGALLYRTEMNEQFVPVGDETGLFIVVKKGRIWFPETKAAMVAPFNVTLSDAKHRNLELNHKRLEVL
jgi:catechol-2,3-dioxygenase